MSKSLIKLKYYCFFFFSLRLHNFNSINEIKSRSVRLLDNTFKSAKNFAQLASMTVRVSKQGDFFVENKPRGWRVDEGVHKVLPRVNGSM